MGNEAEMQGERAVPLSIRGAGPGGKRSTLRCVRVEVELHHARDRMRWKRIGRLESECSVRQPASKHFLAIGNFQWLFM
jgi:hypothetical protein